MSSAQRSAWRASRRSPTKRGDAVSQPERREATEEDLLLVRAAPVKDEEVPVTRAEVCSLRGGGDTTPMDDAEEDLVCTPICGAARGFAGPQARRVHMACSLQADIPRLFTEGRTAEGDQSSADALGAPLPRRSVDGEVPHPGRWRPERPPWRGGDGATEAHGPRRAFARFKGRHGVPWGALGACDAAMRRRRGLARHRLRDTARLVGLSQPRPTN